MAAANESARPGKMGLWMSTALVIGNMVGSGVFLLPAALAAFGGISILGWLFTSAGALFLALTFARLSRLVPGAGGPYTYSRHGFGDFIGFLMAWGYWLSITIGNAGIAVALVGYLAFFMPVIGQNPALSALVALANIWLLTWVNAEGVRKAGYVQVVTTVLKLLPLVVVGTLGFLYFDPGNLAPFNASGGSAFSAITATAALTLWAFLGLESATVPAENVEDPEHTIPRATVIGTLVATGVYILSTVAVMGVMPQAVLVDSSAPFADAARSMWGSWAGYAVAAGAAISSFGALNGWILLQGQLPWAAARDRLFPKRFGRLSGKGTPVFGLVASSVLVTIFMAMNYTRSLVDLFTFVILLSALTSLVPYVFCSMAKLMIFARQPGGLGRKGIRGAVIVGCLAFVYSLWAIGGSGMEAVYWGFMLLLAGIPVYVWLKWKQEPEPAEQ